MIPSKIFSKKFVKNECANKFLPVSVTMEHSMDDIQDHSSIRTHFLQDFVTLAVAADKRNVVVHRRIIRFTKSSQ